MLKEKVNYKWERVYGPDLDKNNKPRKERNAATLKDKVFLMD